MQKLWLQDGSMLTGDLSLIATVRAWPLPVRFTPVRCGRRVPLSGNWRQIKKNQKRNGFYSKVIDAQMDSTWFQKAFRRLLSHFYSIMSFLIHEQLNGYRLPAEANRPIWIPGLTSLAVIFYLLEFVCRHSHCALMRKVPGSAPLFSL